MGFSVATGPAERIAASRDPAVPLAGGRALALATMTTARRPDRGPRSDESRSSSAQDFSLPPPVSQE